ncbi:hypothetical protein DPMN_091279 [Dreissena polymorpha]|uniref:Uncharacterized protein n=1 Tax=Dreissena polymorpha TaxID=45954 RepID=A0A9D4QYZ7_DREPO|nr:hypothetical protein DPMN_091279 [Dreissena polymorpha]
MALNERFDKFESGLETRISNKVAQILDKRINSVTDKMEKKLTMAVDNKVNAMKEEIKAEIIPEIEELKSFASSQSQRNNIALNICIRDLPENEGENTKSKVDKLIKDGLKIKNVTCLNAERKPNRSNSNKPGFVIATMRSQDDKKQVLTNKSDLKDNRQYEDVFIGHDQTAVERKINENFRIFRALKNNDIQIQSTRGVHNGSHPGKGGGNRGSRGDHRTGHGPSRDLGHDLGGASGWR